MDKNKKIILLVLLVVSFLAIAVTSYFMYYKKPAISEEAVSVFSNKVGEEPYSDLQGNPISLESYLGKILVVATWASWSPFSTVDLAMLDKLSSETNSEKVMFMAINRKETKEQASRYMATQPKFENLLVVLDPRDHFYTSVGGYAMPEVVVYNQRGEVILHERGIANSDTIKNLLQEQLTVSD